MKLKIERDDMSEAIPEAVSQALFVIGHWLAKNGPDMNSNFDITEGDEVIQYDFEMKEVKRYPWLVEGEVVS